MLNTKRMRFQIDVILVCIRWYVAYPLSYRHLEEMMALLIKSADNIRSVKIGFLEPANQNDAIQV